MRIAGAVIALAAIPLLRAEPALKNAVTAVRFWSLGDTTRVVIETEKEFEFRSERVEDPERLVFDVLATRMGLAGKRLQSFSVGDQFLKKIRVAENMPGVTRVVFDLEPGVQFSASRLTSPPRLIVELRGEAAVSRKPEAAPPVLAKVAPPADSRSTETALAEPKFTEVAKVTKPARARERMSLPPEKAEPLTEPVQTAAVPSLPRSTVKIENIPDPTKLKERIAVPLRAPRPAKLGSGSSMTRVLGLKIGRIVIDAGHGGHDTGTYGPGGLLEKDLVLDVAKRVGALIESRMGSQVVYTRSDDTFVPLEVRNQIANEQKADLFLSIHANSSPDDVSSGVETYYLNFATSKGALEVAARENASAQKTVHELRDMLQKIALQDKVDESREFAGKVQQALYAASVKGNSRTRDRGVKKAPFVVLIGAAMPSILAEVGFVSNPKDEALFKRPEFRQRIAEGLYRGIAHYAATLSVFNVAKTGR